MYKLRKETLEDPSESDASFLLALIFDALGHGEFVFLNVSPEDFNESGKPQLLYVGRVDPSDKPDVRAFEGRSAVKERFGRLSKKLYKKARSMMMSYEMGDEIPVVAVGADETVAMAVVPFDHEVQSTD